MMRLNNKGSALISAFIAILVIGTVLVGVLSLSGAGYNRALAYEYKSQAYYTALSALDVYGEILKNDAETGKAILDHLKASTGSVVLSSAEDFGFDPDTMGTCQVTGAYAVADPVNTDIEGVLTLTATAVKNDETYTMSSVFDVRKDIDPNAETEYETIWATIPAGQNGGIDFNGAGQINFTSKDRQYYVLKTELSVNAWINIGYTGNTTPIVIFIGDPARPAEATGITTGNNTKINIIGDCRVVFFILNSNAYLNLDDKNTLIPADADIYVLDQKPDATSKGHIYSAYTDTKNNCKIITLDGLNSVVLDTIHSNVKKSLHTETYTDARKVPSLDYPTTHNTETGNDEPYDPYGELTSGREGDIVLGEITVPKQPKPLFTQTDYDRGK